MRHLEFVKSFLGFFRAIGIHVLSFVLWTKKLLECLQCVMGILGLASVALQPMSVPILDHQCQLIRVPRFVLIVEDLVVSGYGIGEFLRFW